jgi:hypothetical protein
MHVIKLMSLGGKGAGREGEGMTKGGTGTRYGRDTLVIMARGRAVFRSALYSISAPLDRQAVTRAVLASRKC